MRAFASYSEGVLKFCDNSEESLTEFKGLLMDASKRIFTKYDAAKTQEVINKGFDKLMGIDFKAASSQARKQAYRRHKVEIAELIEDVILDKMVSGWDSNNAFFQRYVEQKNIAEGDKNEWYVEDNSLLTVSKFAGNHHDIVRQAVKPGKSFSVDTSWYTIKVYADFELMRLGTIDFAELVNRMYTAIEKYRMAAIYEAFMSIDESLPTDMILETQVTEATKDAIIEHAELVKSVTGKDVAFVGSRVAIQKLQSTVSYNMFSNGMKDEQNKNGILANWEGYECLPISRVNAAGTRNNVLDNTKIYIMPIDDEFKPIKDVIEGEVTYYESGMDGSKKDMTVDAEIQYAEGVGVVINELFGEIKITA